MKTIVVLLLALALLILVYYLILPVFLNPVGTIQPIALESVSAARDYYNTISSIVTIVVGSLGLLLGYFYYNNRKIMDLEARERDRKRHHLEYLINELKGYDGLVYRLLKLNFGNATELKQIRADIERTFDYIQDMLEQGLPLLGFNEADMRTILRVNSFVDKCDILMRQPAADMTSERLLVVQDRYTELIKEARRVCYMKLC